MFFKSKWLWISTGLIVCALIFFVVVFNLTNNSQEVIKIYNTIKPTLRKKAKSPVNEPVTKQTQHNILTEIEVANTKPTDLPIKASDRTNSVPDIPEDLPAELNQQVMDDTAAETENHAEKAKELYQELNTNFETYLDILEENNILSQIKVDVEKDELAAEFISLRIEIAEERDRLKRTVIQNVLSYIAHAQDASPFLPGGEFYDLFQDNEIYITINVLR